MLWVGLILALLASALFNVGIGLQAMEARATPPEEGLHLSLLVRLVQRPRWLVGFVLGGIGALVEIAAFANAPFIVVEPVLAAGLLLLLAIGQWELGEKIMPTVVWGVLAIIAGTALIAWGAPPHSEGHRGALDLTAVTAGMGLASLAPFLLRRSRWYSPMLANIASAVGFAATNLAAKLLADDIDSGHPRAVALWLAVAIAAGVTATLSGMTALQRLPATTAVPISTAVQTFLPVALEPLIFTESWRAAELEGAVLVAGLVVMAVGTVLVARSRSVSVMIAS
ncbi:MAG: hypothetical protein QOI84_1596 [Solirubrobacterales bacterium]|jgi:drug/metabolite transporter (DMT)-like permease|nr:hypothetical protein [Solirubrobacterales bacterium]